MNDNTCVTCGISIPEGFQVCKFCLEEGKPKSNTNLAKKILDKINEIVKREYSEILWNVRVPNDDRALVGGSYSEILFEVEKILNESKR